MPLCCRDLVSPRAERMPSGVRPNRKGCSWSSGVLGLDLSTLWYLLPHGWDIAVNCCLCSLSYRQGVTCHSLQIHRGPVSAPVPSRSCFMHPGNLCLLLLQVLCNIPPEPFLQGCHKIRRFPISVGRVCPPPPLALLHHAASPALIFGTEHPRVLALSLRQATLISAATQGGCGDRQPLQKHPASAIKRNRY